MANSNSEVSRELKNKIYAFRVLYGNLLKKAHTKIRTFHIKNETVCCMNLKG